MKTNQPGAALTNTGFDGIALKAGEKYDFSLFARIPEGSKSGKLLVRLVDADGTVPVSYTHLDVYKRQLSPQANNNIAAIAEFDVLGADGKPVSREHWKIRYADSEETRSGNRTADKIFDLQESTFWMTVDNVAYPCLLYTSRCTSLPMRLEQ